MPAGPTVSVGEGYIFHQGKEGGVEVNGDECFWEAGGGCLPFLESPSPGVLGHFFLCELNPGPQWSILRNRAYHSHGPAPPQGDAISLAPAAGSGALRLAPGPGTCPVLHVN